jgi:GR25 family glycosyltransferase involved in LPS biosynthesis
MGGCGMSYSSIARKALESKSTRLTVMEDDVLLLEDFEQKWKSSMII